MKGIRMVVAALLLCAAGRLALAAQELAALPGEKALAMARVGGKYRMLLRQIKVEGDGKEFGAFAEFGYRTATTCADYTDLPKGYWVYVYPSWYIWRDRAPFRQERRAWGPEQATGPPDTPEPGDVQTAWASATPDGSDEWLMLEYKEPAWASSARIYETYNPGSVVRITAFTLDGREVEVWSRARPVVPDSPGYLFRPGFRRRVFTNRIKLYVASREVEGWNEIDAVGLRDESGAVQWATAAEASSTYGVSEERVDPRDVQILKLEDENQALRAELNALKRGLPAKP